MKPGLAAAAGALALFLLAPVLGQPPMVPTDVASPALDTLDPVLGQAVPPALAALYNATGQNITREDVRTWLDFNITKGDVNLLGLLVGSGKAEVQATLHGKLEMRVISSERIRAALQGENAYNLSAENATFLETAYVPAEMFRATASAEVIAAFQRDQEAELRAYLERALPEMDILRLDLGWRNVHPTQSFTDVSLTEPPIVLELDLVVQYIRVESLPGLVGNYLTGKDDPEKTARKEYAQDLKDGAGDPLRSRDFFAAAAYTQLLNLSMQPGWTLDINLTVPRGYSFTYANEQVERRDSRHIALHVDAMAADSEVQEVFLASITHKRAVALALFIALWAVGIVAAVPARLLHGRRRGRLKD